jgi:hypothetical protein
VYTRRVSFSRDRGDARTQHVSPFVKTKETWVPNPSRVYLAQDTHYGTILHVSNVEFMLWAWFLCLLPKAHVNLEKHPLHVTGN